MEQKMTGNTIRLKEVDDQICVWYLLDRVTERDRAVIKGILGEKHWELPFVHDVDCDGSRGSCMGHLDFKEIYPDFMIRANRVQLAGEDEK